MNSFDKPLTQVIEEMHIIYSVIQILMTEELLAPYQHKGQYKLRIEVMKSRYNRIQNQIKELLEQDEKRISQNVVWTNCEFIKTDSKDVEFFFGDVNYLFIDEILNSIELN